MVYCTIYKTDVQKIFSNASLVELVDKLIDE